MIDLEQIQGNVLGGFNKDHQAFLFFTISDPAGARAALLAANILQDTVSSSSAQVLRFNRQFKALRHEGAPEGTIMATWTNVAFTYPGLAKLGATGVPTLPEAFTQGMTARAELIGDTDANKNSPAHWNDGMDAQVPWPSVDGVVIVASDDEEQLDPDAPASRLARYLAVLQTPSSGLTVHDVIRGKVRVDESGHEHFGFKDGVSQPGIRGVTPPDDPENNPDQGNPGQDLLHPGEFVLGYPTQIPHAESLPNGETFDGPNRQPGPLSGENLPSWARNGSFLVFRRLAQNVAGFRRALSDLASQLGTSEDLLGAKLVGRYRSGAPLAPSAFQLSMGPFTPPLQDPGKKKPALADSDSINNDFEYGSDPDGDFVPQAAHIRKAYPRDQVPGLPPGGNPDDAESFTQTHRLLRRGIPFGASYRPGETHGAHGKEAPRGLLFLAYQTDIERQFEFVQVSWVNNANFPQPLASGSGALPSGEDPIITNSSVSGTIQACPFHQTAGKAGCPVDFHHFVNTRGGAYLFTPSVETLQMALGLTPWPA